eukprot:128656_1
MSTCSDVGGNLHSYIDNACSVKDLEFILSSIPIDSIKHFIKEYIDSIKQSECDTLAIRCCPITDILDIDVIQYVLSFSISDEVNSVNKLFNCLSIKNEHIFLNKQLGAKYESVRTTVNKHQLQYIKLQRSSFLLSQSIANIKATLSSLERRKRVVDQSTKEAVTASYNALKSIQTKQDENNSNYDEYFAPLQAIKHIKEFNDTYLIRPRPLGEHEAEEYGGYDNRWAFPIDSKFVDDEYNKTTFDISGCLALKDQCDYTESKCQQLGYKGPYDNLKYSLSQFKSGDKVLLANGAYDGFSKHCFESMDLHFVGLGDYVILRFNDNEQFFSLSGKSNIYFDNIKFDVCDASFGTRFHGESSIEIKDGSCLWMNHCDVMYEGGNAISAGNDTKLYLKNCNFGATGVSGSTLIISPWAANVNVINCRFANGGRRDDVKKDDPSSCHSCIEVQDVSFDGSSGEDLVKLKCFGNTFVNNFGFSVSKMLVRINEEDTYGLYLYGSNEYNTFMSRMVRRMKWFSEFDNRFCELKDNKLQGVNGLNIDQVIDDPNRLYQHQY